VVSTAHDLIADAMAAIGQAQSAVAPRFRYGTHVLPVAHHHGRYLHYIPSPQLGRTNKACGAH